MKLKKQEINTEKLENSLFVNKLIKRVENFLFNEIFIETNDRVLIGLSGGVDSITMLDILYHISKIHGLKIFPVHFNHKLRGKMSDDDEKFTKNVSSSYGLQFLSGNGDVKLYARKNSLGIEHAARILRYNFFERAAHQFNCTMIATAHTLDDLTETFFLNLFRGSGLTGLCSIPKKRHFTKKISIIRPLIKVSKIELITYAKQRGLKWREDDSNLMMNFTRNRIRKKLIPIISNEFEPNLNEKIERTTMLLSGADKFIGHYINSIAEHILYNKTADGFSIKLNIFISLDEFIQGELLQELISTKYHQLSLPMHIIDRIKGLAESNIGTIVVISKELFALRDRNSIIIEKKKKKIYERIEIEKPGFPGEIGEYEYDRNKIIISEVKKRSVKLIDSGKIEYIDYDLVPSRIVIRRWQKGDTFSPLGMKGKMKVSDFLINNKIPLNDKDDVFLLTAGKEIIWICGLRIDDRYKITSKTNRFLKMELVTKGN